MQQLLIGLVALWHVVALTGCNTRAQHKAATERSEAASHNDSPGGRRVVKTEAEWKKILTPAQFAVMREKATERPGSSPLLHNHEKGIYRCAGCKNPLFRSTTKFESGTGWPSFYAPIVKNAVKNEADGSLGMSRTEILCSVCDAHLGHVFDDGPPPTGLRYCMNGVALQFEKAN